MCERHDLLSIAVGTIGPSVFPRTALPASISTAFCDILRESSSQISTRILIMSAKPEALEFEVPADDFQALEEKVYRTVELLKTAREAKATAGRDSLRLREQLDAREEELERLKREMIKLRKDREEVRSRVERMMRQIEDVAAAS
jgi:chromosome segregation ATPase